MSAETISLPGGLLSTARSFFFPGGEETAGRVRGIQTAQSGQMRMSPEARWIPFSAKESVDAIRSNFRWEARLDPGKLGATTVIDAYEEGHGHLAVKLAGILAVKKITGPEVDRGELQRYLVSVLICPAMLLNHPTLECSGVGPSTLRLRDRQDETGATVDLEFGESKGTVGVRAVRPRIVGKHAVDTGWFGAASEFREQEGLPTRSRVAVARGGVYLLPRRDHLVAGRALTGKPLAGTAYLLLLGLRSRRLELISVLPADQPR